MTNTTRPATKAAVLRRIAAGQHGGVKRVWLQPDNGPAFCSYKHLLDPVVRPTDQHPIEAWGRVVALLNRYHRFVHYVQEIEPQWRDGEAIRYADNSVVVLQIAHDGRTRWRTVLGPAGDRCF